MDLVQRTIVVSSRDAVAGASTSPTNFTVNLSSPIPRPRTIRINGVHLPAITRFYVFPCWIAYDTLNPLPYSSYTMNDRVQLLFRGGWYHSVSEVIDELNSDLRNTTQTFDYDSVNALPAPDHVPIVNETTIAPSAIFHWGIEHRTNSTYVASIKPNTRVWIAEIDGIDHMESLYGDPQYTLAHTLRGTLGFALPVATSDGTTVSLNDIVVDDTPMVGYVSPHPYHGSTGIDDIYVALTSPDIAAEGLEVTDRTVSGYSLLRRIPVSLNANEMMSQETNDSDAVIASFDRDMPELSRLSFRIIAYSGSLQQWAELNLGDDAVIEISCVIGYEP